MTLAAQQSNVSGNIQFRASGSRIGVRTAGNFVLTLGFDPQYVRVINLTDRGIAEWFADNGNATQLLTVAAGTMTLADCGISAFEPSGSPRNRPAVPGRPALIRQR